MTRTIALSFAATLLLTGCSDAGKDGPAVKRQPGSWQQKIEIIKLEGPGVKPEDKAKMQQMFGMMGGISVCLTPEAAAQENVAADASKMGSSGTDCSFERQEIKGNTVDFAMTCKIASGEVMKMTGKGTTGATSQDMTVTQSVTKADGSAAGSMVMRVTGTRKGECTASDITPPPAAAPEAKS